MLLKWGSGKVLTIPISRNGSGLAREKKNPASGWDAGFKIDTVETDYSSEAASSVSSSFTPAAGTAIVAIVKSRSVMTGLVPFGSLMFEM